MNTTYDWSAERDRAITGFSGEIPGERVEADILEVFRTRPDIVAAAITKVAAAFHSGRIRSGWAVLRADVQKAHREDDVVVTDSRTTAKLVARAEQWVRAAGLHYPTVEECLMHLFGVGGILAEHRDDRQLQDRIELLWLEVRPEGEKIEREADERGVAYAAAMRKSDRPAQMPDSEHALQFEQLRQVLAGGPPPGRHLRMLEPPTQD